jgi:hypothetical protein
VLTVKEIRREEIQPSEDAVDVDGDLEFTQTAIFLKRQIAVFQKWRMMTMV